MIVKDEEKALPGCLESLRGVVDEIVIYDTGSTDATVEIAKSAGAKVIEGYWDDDFGRARNASLEHCRGAWILWIDADEHFVCENPAELRSIMRDKLSTMDADALAVDINNLVGDGSQAGNLHRALRIFRQSTCCWYGSLHEQVDLRAGLGRRAIVLPLVGARIDHYGYMDQVLVERGKLQRNLRLAEAELATGVVRPDQEGVPHLNVGRALAALGRLEEAQVFFDEAMSLVAPGVPTRTVLMFKVQNLLGLGRLEDAVTAAKSFREVCQNKGLADYLEGVAQRRLGNPELAAALFQRVEQVNNEDGFAFSDTLVIAELAGALLECGRAAEAADQLVLLVEQKPDLVNLTAALQVFAATGKSIEALVAAMPEDRLDRIAAALILVPPSVADPMAEALFERFGPRPALLAAAIRFAPMVPVGRALGVVCQASRRWHGGLVPARSPSSHRGARPSGTGARRGDSPRRLRGPESRRHRPLVGAGSRRGFSAERSGRGQRPMPGAHGQLRARRRRPCGARRGAGRDGRKPLPHRYSRPRRAWDPEPER